MRISPGGRSLAAATSLAIALLWAPQMAPAAAADQYGSCIGGAVYPNSLSVQWQWFGTQWQVYLSAYVTPVLAVSGASTQLVSTGGGTINLHAPTSDGISYYWTGWINQSELGLYNPGDASTFHLHFIIPLEPDRDTCAITGYYSAPPPTPTPTPLPLPSPTPMPAPSVQVYTVNLGQPFNLTLTAGTPYSQGQWQMSRDRVAWTTLATVTLDASGNSTYTFTPSQTAYYRTYFPALATFGSWLIEVIVVQPSPTPLPTPTPQPAPQTIPAIFTITWGDSATITSSSWVAGTTVRFEGSTDNAAWSVLGATSADASGVASLTFRPVTNLFMRTMSPSGTPSGSVRGLVRQVAMLRPTAGGRVKTVRRGATVTFATTIRPSTSASSAAVFRIYRWTGTAWSLRTQRGSNADATGVARLVWTFTSPGRWYVRSMAASTPLNANSLWSQVERFNVP